MKSAQLPPVRVEPAVRAEIESMLRPGETLSQFVENAAIQTAQRRRSQQEFLARGRASLKRAEKTGEYFAAADVLDGMRARLEARMAQLRAGKSKSGKSVGS